MRRRKLTAHWEESCKRWRVNAQRDGKRKTFYSTIPGQHGKKEAERKADSWKNSSPYECRDPIVAELWECFLNYLQEEKRVGISTLEQTRKFGRNYILPVCGSLRISQLNEGHLQRVLNLSAQKGCLRPDSSRPPKGSLSLKTLRGLRNVEQQFVKWCRIHGYSDLVLEGLEARTSVQKQEKAILQPEELKTLFHVDTRVVRGKQVFDDQVYSYRFAVVTGLRPGELMGLRIGDVQDGKLYIRQAINSYGEITNGKNQNARRTFGLNSFAQRIIQQQLELLVAYKMPIRSDSPLFPALNQQSRYHQWKSYAKSNGITAISCYEMRHTFSSLAQNLPEGDLRRLCGQSKSMDARGVYAHKLSDNDARIATEVDEILNRYIAER